MLTVWLEIPPSAAFHEGRNAAALWIAYLGKRRSLPGKPSCCPDARFSGVVLASTMGLRFLSGSDRLLLASVQFVVPEGWNAQENPGNGRGGVLTGGGTGGYPTADAYGLSHGK